MKLFFNSLIPIFLGCFPLISGAQTSHLASGAGNPVIPGYFADPTVKKFGDTYYIYATTDGNGGGFGPSQVWSSKDFVNWSMQDMNWPTTHHYWAPDATKGPDSLYYLYYCQPVEIFGASSKSPTGPWTSLLPAGKPIVSNFMVPNVITLDGQTFKDDDGKYYMYWGTWGIYPNHGCGVGLLNEDMKSFAKLAQIPNTDAKDFFEAPFVFKRKGIYYLTYSSGYCEDGTYRVQYATSNNPMGPFKYAKDNPILATNADGSVHGPGHQSVLQQGEDFYLIYHRHNNPHNDGGYHRQVAADKIVFDEGGNILKLIPTHSGIGYLSKNSNPHPNLALGKTVTASSTYDQDFRAEFALDDNNGTLWKAKNNIGPSWLKIDLGKPTSVKSIQTQFEYATWYYQYRIEYSLDGKNWKTYADRSRNTQHGSPMMDFGNVKARYLRTTILRTEYPGLNKAIWNVKVFDNDEYRPLVKTIVKKWESLEPFESKGLLVDLNLQDLPLGTSVDHILNKGKLSGTFLAKGQQKPTISMIEGKRALVFSGREQLISTNPAPSSLMGNSSFSVAVWVHNPEIGKEETILGWTGRGGINLSNASVGYGSSKSAGAVSHLGWADMGYKNIPRANQWHHIAWVFDGTKERIYVDGKIERDERRMLFIRNLTPFRLGGNEDGTAGFSGAIAALKVYDIPLTSQEVARAFTKGVSDPLLVYADAKSLDYGRIKAWRNHGTALGELQGKGDINVEDVKGKIAVVLNPGSVLSINPGADGLSYSKPLTAVFATLAQKGSKNKLLFAGQKSGVNVLGNGKWQQVICVYSDGNLQTFIDGILSSKISLFPVRTGEFCSIQPPDKEGVSLAVSAIQIYDYNLDKTAREREFANFKRTLSEQDVIASFSSPPVALGPNMADMTAGSPRMPGSGIEYLFSRADEKTAAKWQSSAHFVDFSLQPQKRYQYTLKVRDNFGNVSSVSKPYLVSTDEALFTIKMQKGDADLAPADSSSLSRTNWDGLIGKADSVVQKGGILTLVSTNTLWDGTAIPGPFVFNKVSGDFIAEVRLTDILGLSQRKAFGANEGGIMVKSAQGNRKLVQSGVMTGWGIGNIVTDLGGRGRQQYNNQSGWDFFRWLQIQRAGNTFYMRGSKDGEQWVDLPGSPIKRDDMGSEPLQVGLYHATYGEVKGFASFKDFRIIKTK